MNQESEKSDHLGGEVAVSAELTPTGVVAKAKSRTVAAIDRLAGALVDLATPHLEGFSKRQRARNDADTALIDALGAKRVELINADPEQANLAIAQHLRTIGRRHENKRATAAIAIEDLRSAPPTDEEMNAGPEELDPDFMARFERYAEDASSEVMRERWGRVLASEIRAPGTFSSMVMRTIDEVDVETAQLFQDICKFRTGSIIPEGALPNLTFIELINLITAGLIVDPGSTGKILLSGQTTDNTGLDLITFSFDGFMAAVPADATSSGASTHSGDVVLNDKTPALKVYILTKAGAAISTIMPDTAEVACGETMRIVSQSYPSVEVREYRKDGSGGGSVNSKWRDGQRLP